MGQQFCTGYRLADDPFLQLQLLYSSDQIKPLIKTVNQTQDDDPTKIYKFGNWNIKHGMTGVGIVYFPKHYYYDGGIRKGTPHGTGRIIWPNEDNYRGDVAHGKASGRGKFDCPRRAIKYEGEWVDGHPSRGTMEYNNLKRQVQFNKNKQITIKLQDGIVYSGNVILQGEEYIVDGHGKMTFPDGSYYEGHFKDGNMHGRGDFFWRSGQRYSGNYHTGTKEGYGTYYYNSSKCYEGNWQNGTQNGQGSILVNGKKVFSGRWKDGNPQNQRAY